MKIKKMTAYFGGLEGRTLTLGDGLNIIYAPNESGKSTWCAFLRTMLYGVNTAQRAKAGQKPDKVKYRPWSGAPMSGSMELACDLGPVTLRRWTERANQPMQAFSATVTGTESAVPELVSDTAGETLTGMPREVFERSAFIRQAGIEMTNEPELDRRISAIASSGDEEVSFLETEARLKSWQRHRRSGKRGAIPELEAQMDEARRTLESIRGDAEVVTAAEGEIARLESEQEAAILRMQEARARQRKRALAELAEARGAVQLAEEKQKTAERAFEEAEEAAMATPYKDLGVEEAAKRSETDRANAEELLRLADKLPPVKLAFIPLATAVLAFLLAIVLPWHVECAGVGCILMLLFVVMYTRLLSIQRTKADTLAQRQRILDAYGVSSPEEIDGLLADYRRLWQARQKAELRLEDAEEALSAAREAQHAAEAWAVNALDFTNGDNEAARAGQEAEAIRARITRLKERRAEAEGRARALGDPMALESELANGERRREELLSQERALTLALDTLRDADAELQQRVSPRLAKRAQELFAALTGGRYDEVTLTRDFAAKARPAGEAVGWEADYLSAGAKDQLYLALRLAVCELALPSDDPCPIVLDDALVNFDEERMALALVLLREMAKERQILLFTCHRREGEYFRHDRSVTRIDAE